MKLLTVYRLYLSLVIAEDAARAVKHPMSLAECKKASGSSCWNFLYLLFPVLKMLIDSFEFNLKYEYPYFLGERKDYKFLLYLCSFTQRVQTMGILKKQTKIPISLGIMKYFLKIPSADIFLIS